MNVVLWIIASLLALVFLASGLMKLALTKEKLIANGMAAAEVYGNGVVKTIGVLEVAAAIGLILPAWLDIAPVLVPLAAFGLILLMIGAALFHARRKESQGVAITMVLLLLSAVVVWGRFGPYAFFS